MQNSEGRLQSSGGAFSLLGLGVAVSVLVLVGARAEPEKKEKGGAEAVKELELLKNSPELLKQEGTGGLVLPQPTSPDAPAMTFAPRPVLGPETLEKAQKEAKKEQNWLVEGYWRQVREHTRTDEMSRQGRSDWIKTTLGAELWLPKGGQNSQVTANGLLDLEESRKTELPAPEAPKAADPLQPFLATWLSARDYQIMQKARAAGGETGVSAGPTQELGELPKSPIPVAENPYIKALNDGLLAGSASGSLPIQTAGQAGAGMLPTPPPAAETPPVLAPLSEPEKAVNPLSQKDEDRKYYPQLKRF